MKKINKKQRRTFDAISNSDHITLRRRRHALHDLHSHFDSCFFNSAGFEKIRTGWQGWDDVPTPISGNQLGHSRRSLTDKPKRHFCVCVRRKHTTTAANVGFESWNGNVKLECWTVYARYTSESFLSIRRLVDPVSTSISFTQVSC
jgi:hypothetical protein